MTKEKNQRLKSTKETSRINPRDIDAKNAPVIERTFPTVMEKNEDEQLREGFSSECEDVLHEARAKVRKFDDNNINNNELEKKRAFVLRESLIDAEEKEEKERIQFPLTTIGEDFSIGQSNARKRERR